MFIFFSSLCNWFTNNILDAIVRWFVSTFCNQVIAMETTWIVSIVGTIMSFTRSVHRTRHLKNTSLQNCLELVSMNTVVFYKSIKAVVHSYVHYNMDLSCLNIYKYGF